jgi:hypothetical protein
MMVAQSHKKRYDSSTRASEIRSGGPDSSTQASVTTEYEKGILLNIIRLIICMQAFYMIDVNTSRTPEEGAHSPSWPNGLIVVII